MGDLVFKKEYWLGTHVMLHLTDYVKSPCLVQSGCEQVIVPGGCTKYIKVRDIVWNKTFKAKIVYYYQWPANGIHEYTAAGNLKPVPR